MFLLLQSTKSVTVDQIKAVLSEHYKETKEETYDIYLLPPGEDPEACQSYLRMRNRDGKYNLMFEVRSLHSKFFNKKCIWRVSYMLNGLSFVFPIFVYSFIVFYQMIIRDGGSN